MATYKTPEELRAWSRSFGNKSKVIKRGSYNYIPNEKKADDSDASKLASSILSEDSSYKPDINDLFGLNASEIEEMNSKYPSTQEQMAHIKKR